MASKFELITDIYRQISKEVVRSPYNWQSFLSSVCHNYRLRFDEQLLVYAQRPDATAVLETVRWNNKFHRWVNRGAKGIAVFSERRNLKYYFDISDTHETDNAIPVPVWGYKAEYEADVIETLENSFGELEDKSDIYNAVMSAADNAVEDNISDYLSDLLMITKDSFLEELDDDIVSSLYKNTVKNSIAYMLLSRLGIDTSEYFSREDFKDIVNFNTPDTLNSIGYATSDISETVLYEISKTIKSLEMENRIIADNSHSDYTKAVNKNIERSADYDRTHLQNGKRLSDTKYRYAKSEEFDLELIWADEEETPQGTSQSDLLQSDDIRQTEQSSVGNRPESESNGRKADETDVRAGRIDGTDESRQSDSLGAGNEQSETESSRDRIERGSLQSVTDELPPFTDDNLILGILKNADDELSVSKRDIVEYFKYHSDTDDRKNFIMQAYPDVYCELDVDNIRVGYKPEKDGLLLWKGAYLSRTEESFFSWNIVSEIIEQLIDSGEYVTADKEKDEPLQFSIFDLGDSLPQPQTEEVKADEKTPLEIRSELYREYLKKKAEYPDDILLWQHGDFYKIYGDDATKTHDIVTFIMTDVTMDNGETIPIYSIPKTQSRVYINRLVENGFSVAISNEDNGQRQDTVLLSENVEKPSTSPVWDEYRDIKRIYKDDIILYQVGDFFEVMGDDAKIVAEKFDLVLTGRDVGYDERIAMCGFPVRSQEKYIKGLNALGYAVVVSSLDNGKRREDSYLPDEKPTDKMPVGVIDYLASDGTVGYSTEFYDEKEFVDEINDNSDSGVPTSVKVYSNPETDEHISTSFLNDLDPPMKHFEIAEYEQPVAEEIETADPEQSEDKDKPLTAPQSQPKSRVQIFDLHPEIPMSERHDYNFADKEIETVGKKERFRRNMAAIKVLKDCEFENRFATPDEQEILSGYVGWGGIPEAFDENNETWADEFIELYETLSPNEYKTAMDSVLTAFYTPQPVISAIYKALDNLGFKQGNILEPSCAIGNFIGMLPDKMKDSKMYGVEIDSISAGIAQQLYQTSSIMTSPFENAEMPDSFFDAVVGNVPFGDIRVTDKRYEKNKFLIHDYFFAKSLDKLRPGGIMCLVTSQGTMDKEGTAVRKYIAQRADLLGAIRLPNNTFKGNAGTDVTSDILILQKRDRITDIEPEWVNLDADENGIRMNKYFVDNPDMVLGEMVMKSGRFGEESTCKPSETESLESLLDKAVSNIKGEITDYYIDDVVGEDEEEYIPADPSVRNFSFTVVDGKVYYRENSLMRAINTNMTAENRIKGMIAIRDCLRNLIEMQTKDVSDFEIQKEQEKLNSLYDNFSKKYGLINSRGNSSAFCDDSAYYLLCSLEIIKEGELERKADIFTKRTIQPHIAKTHADTSTEALGICIGEKAKVDMDFMCQLTGKTEQQIYEDLKGVIFLNPMYKYGNGNHEKYLTADEYLSGNVREKLDFAKRSAKLYPEDYTVNVEALEKVQTVDLTAAEISVQLGANWIPIKYIEQFVFELLETPIRSQWNINVHYSEYTGEWNIDGKSVDRGNLNSTSTYGTDRINAYRIIENTLNMRDVRVFDYVEDAEGKRKAVLNQNETAAAQAKQKIIKQKFKEWLWSDPERREELCKLYNEKFNSIRPREYDGKHIVFGGMNPEITLTQHQRNAAARAIYGGNTLLAHCVGAGKTFEMTAIAQESKRLGLCNKSLFVVPNHLISQWASEYLTLYPTANILVSTKKDFEKRNRKKFCAKIATGDYDAVIIGHSQFEKIPVSIDRQIACLEEQIREITEGIAMLKADNGENFTVKQLVGTRKRLEEKMKRLNDQSRKDDVVTFEELGVDRLFVDESHYFKNLFTYSKMRNVGGISQVDALKSSDLFMKCQYLDELTDSKGVIFATGTPISNSMVELFTVQRYLQYELLRKQNLLFFDAWVANYGETVNSIELKPEGTGYRAKTRLAKYNNLPELMAMFKECADIQTADMLKLPVPKANYHNISVKPSDIQSEMVDSLADRAETIRAGLVDANVDNMLKVTNDGRKLALDQRLINPMLPDFEDSKVNICINNVFEIWEHTADKKSTQLLFCDLSTPKKDGTFSVYNDIRDKLIAKGIPPEEIAFIHDADTDKKKADLFAKVRSGDVRVLLGSAQKMGAGTNVQDKLIAIHNLDCPWRPSDLEQRLGRIVRRGNENEEVEIYRYVTEGTFDAYLYQLVETKQKFISQIMTGKSPVRSMEDADDAALSYAEVKMLATGNPIFKEKMDLEIQLQTLTMLKTSYLSEKYSLEDKINKEYPKKITAYKEEISGLEKDIQTAKAHPKTVGDKFAGIKIRDEFFSEKEAAGNAIINHCKAIGNSNELHHVGEYRGFELYVNYEKLMRDYAFHLKGAISHLGRVGTDAVGNITRLDNVIEGMENRKTGYEDLLLETEKQLETAKNNASKPFEQEEELQSMQKRLDEINIELNLDDKGMEIFDAEPDEMDIPQKSREQIAVR